jgi:hypothetical protein
MTRSKLEKRHSVLSDEGLERPIEESRTSLSSLPLRYERLEMQDRLGTALRYLHLFSTLIRVYLHKLWERSSRYSFSGLSRSIGVAQLHSDDETIASEAQTRLVFEHAVSILLFSLWESFHYRFC